ncbi:fumarylacetoacetate hydrolase family protein [Novilysobacter spongiicola]|uniref:2-keto-4-pentenoate hydratase/2-oxohepta-3-ene-1,7-dioic acid hydratase (Catechol pathway) n=1 Tax=Lysobacter spongiicola DSM 21749 TaxID=1122188 RepID=A0A1T4RZ29_9GAMM|nr:fumarylacetoacetate hydrolase family protein [Lysobacter spongiicola]SKA21259.1 2-keto-4-pentenoate hydratase/2-oxohepta-3-ene-1,7-dioic acid hydratase (catechol pathway) [Lysobacter spongiicola DSM 21749]
MSDVVQVAPPTRIPVRATDSTAFPVRRVYCVGRNFADHAREMGATAPSSRADRGTPVFFCKPADAIVPGGVVPYPPGTSELHHEVELVVALGADAPPGELDRLRAEALVFGYGIGLDLTRRDLQAAAKAKGLPWDVAKAFDRSAPVSELVVAADVPKLDGLGLELRVNGEVRQQGRFTDLIWDVPDILIELSRLFELRAGDVVFMGTPAGVGPLQPGDEYLARLGDVVELQGRIELPATTGGTP